MPFAAHLSTDDHASRALDALLTQADAFAGPADLALLFYSAHHVDRIAALGATAQRRLGARCLLGCPGETIIGNAQEVEQQPALALWLGRWPEPVRLTPFHLTAERTSDGFSLLGWPDALADADPKESLLLTLADPFSFPVDLFLERLNTEKPGLAVAGGMASVGMQPGQNLLLLNGEVANQGAVGVLLEGSLGCRSIVSQGCRPIGKPLVVTKAKADLVLELGGKPAVAQLQELWQTLPPADQALLRQGLHLGCVINEYQDTFQRGDFLIRNVTGLDRATGAIGVADHLRVGQTVQFHLRDAHTADEDFRALLQGDRKAQGGLLFSCNGRGTRLFDQPNHDAEAVQAAAGPLPLAGFFAQGELGPIGRRNFIHGFTASLVLFDAP